MTKRCGQLEPDLAEWEEGRLQSVRQQDGDSCGPFVLLVEFYFQFNFSTPIRVLFATGCTSVVNETFFQHQGQDFHLLTNAKMKTMTFV